MSENVTAAMRCARCGKRIEECACCNEADCGDPICYHCLNVAVGQEMPQPHAHGG